MSRVKVGLNGIVRNIPESTVKDGACEEIINMRYRDEAWRPVSKKSDFGCMPMDFEQVWVHKGNDYVNYIGYKDEKLYWFDKDKCKVLQEISINDKVNTVSFLGNLMRVLGSRDMYNALFYDNKYALFSDIELPILRFQVKEKEDNKYVFTGAGLKDAFDSHNEEKLKKNDADELRKLRGTIKGLYGKSLIEKKKDGWFEGHVLVRYAIRLFDGSYYQYSPILHFYSPSYDEQNVVISIKDLPLGISSYFETLSINKMKSTYMTVFDDNAFLLIMRLGAIHIEVPYGFEGGISEIKHLIQGVDVFVSKPVSRVDFDNIVYSNKYTTNGKYNLHWEDLSKKDLEKALFEENVLFYKAKELSVEDLTAGNSFELSFDFNDITSNPILSDSNSYAHSDIPNVMYSYNNRVIMGDITTSLFDGYSASYLSEAKKDSGKYKVFFRVFIQSDNGIKSVTTKASYFDNLPEQINSILGYPDSMAKKMEMFIYDSSSDTYVKRTFKLKKSSVLNYAYYFNSKEVITGAGFPLPEKEFLNGYPIEVAMVGFIGDYGSGYPDYGEDDKVLKLSNKVKVSALNNPLVYPAKNTYLVGKGEVLGFTSNAVALSQGQFGQYPLFVFTSEGIWAMEQGNGEVLYRSVVPVNREVCSSPKSITQLDRATVFVSQKGLMLIVGTDIREISIPIEGSICELEEHNATYREAISNSKLVRLSSAHSEAWFKEYMKEANFGYDYVNKELIVSNGDYGYSYVYGFDTGVWHKTSENYSSFVNNYPKTLGVSGTKLYDVSVEDETNTQVLIQTKPLKFNEESYKELRRVILRGLLKSDEGKVVGFYVFGSYDAKEWAYIGGIQNKDEFRDMVAKVLHTDCKYYKIVFAGEVSYDSYVNYFELDVSGELQNRMR